MDVLSCETQRLKKCVELAVLSSKTKPLAWGFLPLDSNRMFCSSVNFVYIILYLLPI